MKIRVISEFYDKYRTSTLFPVGAVLDFDEARAKDVIAKKLAEPYVEPEKKKPGRPAKTDAPAVKPDVKVEEKADVKADAGLKLKDKAEK